MFPPGNRFSSPPPRTGYGGGPVTAEAARQPGWRRVATAARPDAEAAADALVAALAVPR